MHIDASKDHQLPRIGQRNVHVEQDNAELMPDANPPFETLLRATRSSDLQDVVNYVTLFRKMLLLSVVMKSQKIMNLS